MLSAIQAFVNFVLFSMDHFWVLQNRASCKIFLVKMSVMCMGIKNYSHFNGCAFTSSLALKQRLGATRKWPFYYLRGSAHCSLQLSWSNKNAVIMYVRIIQLKDGELSLFSNIWAIMHFSEKSSTHLVILLFHETYSKPF